MAITAEMVKQLRDKTGAGMMDCKAALAEANGDMEKAIDILRKKGVAIGRQARRPGHQRGRHRPLHPHGRQGRRAGRGQLRDRLRRPHRRLPDAGQGAGDARRRRRPAATSAATRSRPRRSRRRRRSTGRSSPGSGKPAGGRRQDRRGQAGELLQPGVPGRPAVGPRSRRHHPADAAGGHRQDRREHHRSRASSASSSARPPSSRPGPRAPPRPFPLRRLTYNARLRCRPRRRRRSLPRCTAASC